MNDVPVAVNDTATTAEDTAVSITVLTNDSDVDPDTLSVSAVTLPAHGSAVINPDKSITYTPAGNYSGADSFGYTIGDGNGGSASATVTVTVTSTNDGPVAVNDAATTAEDTAVSGNVLTNDTDVDAGTTLTATLVAERGERDRDAGVGRQLHLHAGGELQRHATASPTRRRTARRSRPSRR